MTKINKIETKLLFTIKFLIFFKIIRQHLIETKKNKNKNKSFYFGDTRI